MTEKYSSKIFLGRQPILGREQQLLAYELLFRSGPIVAGNQARINDPAQATATVIANAFSDLSVTETLGPYRGFINVDERFLFSDLIEALSPELVVLELLESVPPTPEVVARCRQLRDLGFCLALDDVIKVDETYRPLLELAEIIKVDVPNVAPGELAALVEELKPFGKKLLAEKVESAEQVETCKRLGFDLFQGYYFARPVIIIGKKLKPSQLSLLRLLELVMRDAETRDIENAFKVEPGLTVNMLRLSNSVSNGLVTRITSLRHAITLLGRKQLQRWLQLLIYTSPGGEGPNDNPLLPLAATRGRLMELLAGRSQPHNRELADQGFLVGVMSLMPALLGVPLEEILAQLPVTPRVSQALLEQDGMLGALLRLVLSTEQTDPQVIEDALLSTRGISVEVLENCLYQAFYWANNLGREQPITDAEPE
ncbi:MAG: EAL domain-containing protein [Candidatus Accumulibacter sp.]|jgi:EAL and modified HD-GYP domain-containing signal transduction protein|nr:EAL domain-containing protein [Accumulibacter sp.]